MMWDVFIDPAINITRSDGLCPSRTFDIYFVMIYMNPYYIIFTDRIIFLLSILYEIFRTPISQFNLPR